MYKRFALKYIFSKKNTRAINIISWVSISALIVGTAALVIVLSVFNGIEDFVKKQYTNFYTDISISPQAGKSFIADADLLQYLKSQKEVQSLSTILQENVYATHNNKQSFITLRGVDTAYNSITNFNNTVIAGDTHIANPDFKQMILGQSLCGTLEVSEQSLEPIILYAFNKDAKLSMVPEDAIRESPFYVTGVFAVQQEFDSKYGITSLQNVRDLLQAPDAISSIEIQLRNKVDADAFVKKTASKLTGNNLQAQTRLQQNKTLYYVLQSEKWMVFAVMSLLLLIASFNMIGSLSMLVMEKQKDISLLKAIGGSNRSIRNIFLATGLSISLIGAVLGILLAIIVCLLQMRFGIFTMGSDNLLLSAYPVSLQWLDVVLVFITVLLIGFLASIIPSIKAGKQSLLIGLK